MAAHKGLGDTVEFIIKAAGYYKKKRRPCEECERRKKWLNKVFPYKRRGKK